MSCKECAERRKLAREALYRSAVGEAVGHVAKGAAELVGLKPKTATAERKQAATKRKTGSAGKKATPANTEKE